jgi:copper chaperone NosL
MNQMKLPGWIRTMVIVCGLALFGVLFLPVWRIDLAAPQYPEGLMLLIYANKLGGSVDIINGLNHYIGMKTLHTEDFIEFTVLPFIIGGLAVLTLITGFINRKKIFYAMTIVFIASAVVTMADFWRWEYNYGHDLNPDAAIKVPGMAYQPPLIGYKQLLNFSAYSIPASGGWIFISVGVVLTACAIYEIARSRKENMAAKKYKVNKVTTACLIFIVSGLLYSCNTHTQPIQFGKDNCDFCRMTLSDERFGAEIITSKGKVYKFDDLYCLVGFLKDGKVDTTKSSYYLVDFANHQLQPAAGMYILKSDALRSPMHGNMAAFNTKENLTSAQKQFNGDIITWNDALHSQ